MFPKQTRLIDNKLLESVRKQACVFCGRFPPSEACHVKTVKSGGPDIYWNVMPLCNRHHRLQHNKGWKWMSDESWAITVWLKENEWYFSGTALRHRLVSGTVEY